MEPTIVSPDQFIREVKSWGITPESRHKVRMMEKKGFVYFRFYAPSTGEVIQTVIKKEEYGQFKFIELAPISVGAIWEDEIKQIKNMTSKLEELNAIKTYLNWNIGKGNRQ